MNTEEALKLIDESCHLLFQVHPKAQTEAKSVINNLLDLRNIIQPQPNK